MFFIALNILIPIKISTGPVAADGITRASGARNREIPKKILVKMTVSLSYHLLHTRRRFQICGHARHTEQCSKTCGNSIHFKTFINTRQIAVFVQVSCFRSNTENRTKSREEIRYKQGDQERNISKIQQLQENQYS